MFTPEFRDQVRGRLLELAADDGRIVAGAEVGSAATGEADRWSDLDLTFAVDGAAGDVADSLGAAVDSELGGVPLFDIWGGPALYRVFLLPGCLQVDLSFAPAAEWGARGPRFRLLFGEPGDPPAPEPSEDEDHFGVAVHHAVRARICIERGLCWQAEYLTADVRQHALALACLERGLPGYGRGLDRLPPELLDEAALVRSLDRDELLRALGATLDLLRRVGGSRARPLEERFRELVC